MPENPAVHMGARRWHHDNDRGTQITQPSSLFPFTLSLDEYEAANLREGLLMLRRIGCDTGDWLGQILFKLPETTREANQTVEQQVGNVIRYGRLEETAE